MDVKEIVSKIEELGEKKYKELWERTNVLEIEFNKAKEELENPKNIRKLFFGNYVFESQGAPRLYSATAVLTLQNQNNDKDDKYELFKKYNEILLLGTNDEKYKKNSNNLFTRTIKYFKNNSFIENIKNGDIEKCYRDISNNRETKIPGAGPKIASFFVRDIVWIFREEIGKKYDEIKRNKYIQPIDVNLARLVILLWGDDSELRKIKNKFENNLKEKGNYKKKLSDNELNRIREFICGDESKEKPISNPISFNQGGWYLFSHPSEKKCREIIEKIIEFRKNHAK